MLKCPKCQKPMIGVEYPYNHPQYYDGISEWDCLSCDLRLGRWTLKTLTGDECEKRKSRVSNGRRGSPVSVRRKEEDIRAAIKRHDESVEETSRSKQEWPWGMVSDLIELLDQERSRSRVYERNWQLAKTALYESEGSLTKEAAERDRKEILGL